MLPKSEIYCFHCPHGSSVVKFNIRDPVQQIGTCKVCGSMHIEKKKSGVVLFRGPDGKWHNFQ